MNIIIDHIINNKSIVYAKYGDGEYYAATNQSGMNCDRTPYTPELGAGIISSFKYLTQIPSVYIGKREELSVVAYFESLVSTPIQWMDYHIFMFTSLTSFLEREPIYRTIKNAPQQKIYICNKTMVDRSKLFLKIDTHIIVDKTNWFTKEYATILTNTSAAVKNRDSVMFLLSAGMGAKVLIADLYRQFPNAIILDIGSMLDYICSLRASRDYHRSLSAKDINTIYKRLAD